MYLKKFRIMIVCPFILQKKKIDTQKKLGHNESLNEH